MEKTAIPVRQAVKKTEKIDILIFAFILMISTFMLYFSGPHRNDITAVDTNHRSETIRFGWWGNDERHIYTLKGVDLLVFLWNVSIVCGPAMSIGTESICDPGRSRT